MDELRSATHTNYQHRNHLRVKTDAVRKAWSLFRGWFEVDAMCVAPSHSRHSALSRKNLPCFKCGHNKTCWDCNV